MNKLAAVAQLSVCFVLLFCISGSGQTRPAELVGSWKCEIGNYEILELKGDGTGIRQGNDLWDKIRWKVENGNLVITGDNGTLKLMSEYIDSKNGKLLSNVVKGCKDGRPAELVRNWNKKLEDYKVL